MTNRFIPENFEIPNLLETDKFRLRMLSVNDVVKDYDAVMTSIEHLQKTKPFGPNSDWPKKNLTFEEDLIDLEWHQKEFQNRTSFAYTVMNLDETQCLGCIYIYPSNNPEYEAVIIIWVRQSELKTSLDQLLFSSVKKWIEDRWPFDKVAYPGRHNSWKEV